MRFIALTKAHFKLINSIRDFGRFTLHRRSAAVFGKIVCQSDPVGEKSLGIFVPPAFSITNASLSEMI
jgi:hypothetical protein